MPRVVEIIVVYTQNWVVSVLVVENRLRSGCS
jgi:hypothetical protein